MSAGKRAGGIQGAYRGACRESEVCVAPGVAGDDGDRRCDGDAVARSAVDCGPGAGTNRRGQLVHHVGEGRIHEPALAPAIATPSPRSTAPRACATRIVPQTAKTPPATTVVLAPTYATHLPTSPVATT